MNGREPHTVYTVDPPQFLVPVKTKFYTCLRFKRWALMTIGMLILIVLCGTLTGFLFRKVAGSAGDPSIIENICVSQECLYSATSLKMSMDTTVDPCDNFAQFVCGNWSDAHPSKKLTSYTWFHKATDVIQIKLRNVLSNYKNASLLPLKNTLSIYSSCLINENTFQKKKKNTTEIHDMKALLKSLYLIHDEISLRNGTKKSLMQKAASVKRNLNINTFFNSFVSSYLFDNSYNVIIMYLPKLENFLNGDIEQENVRQDIDEIWRKGRIKRKKKTKIKQATATSEDSEERRLRLIKLLKDTMLEIVSNGTHLSGKYKFNDEKLLDERINIAYTVMENWEEELESRQMPKDNEEDYDEDYEDEEDDGYIVTTVNQLQYLVDKYRLKYFAHKKISFSLKKRPRIWTEFFGTLLKDIVRRDQIGKIPLIVIDMPRVYSFSVLCDEVDNTALELFLWWSVVIQAKNYVPGRLRNLLEDEIPTSYVQTWEDTTIYCANKAQYLMPYATTRMFIEHESNVDLNTWAISNSFKKIRNAYANMIKEVNWLDKDSRQAIMNKLYKLRWIIGFPEWIKENDILVDYYSDVTLKNDSYLDNWVKIMAFNVYGQLDSLNYLNDDDEAAWPDVSPLSVNAFFSPQRNQMTIPYGIITFPFFGYGLESMNFGSLGMIIGHEISHGFDPRGKLFDDKGDYKNTWTEKVDKEYKTRTACYVEHYDEYYVPQADRYVSGDKTLTENVADNCGLAASFRAYKQWRQDNGEEPLLPGFIDYTHEQLLYISFANMWCGRFTKTYYEFILDDVHPPNEVRVFGTLRNSPEFSEVWKCKPGSYMNPKKKCSIW